MTSADWDSGEWGGGGRSGLVPRLDPELSLDHFLPQLSLVLLSSCVMTTWPRSALDN